MPCGRGGIFTLEGDADSFILYCGERLNMGVMMGEEGKEASLMSDDAREVFERYEREGKEYAIDSIFNASIEFIDWITVVVSYTIGRLPWEEGRVMVVMSFQKLENGSMDRESKFVFPLCECFEKNVDCQTADRDGLGMHFFNFIY